MPLDPRFTSALLDLLSSPPAMVDVALAMFYPDVSKDFRKWASMQLRPPPYHEVYKYLAKSFPAAPELSEELPPEDMFRELFKCIIAQAFNLDYKPASKIVLAK